MTGRGHNGVHRQDENGVLVVELAAHAVAEINRRGHLVIVRGGRVDGLGHGVAFSG